MRRILAKLMATLSVVSAVAGGMMVPAVNVVAANSAEVMAVKTNIIGGGEVDTDGGSGKEAIMHILKLVVSILIYGLGVAAVLGVVICGILYMTARDNETQVTMAKKRLFDVVIGLIAWAVMFAVLNWLLPGGVNFDL